MSIEYDENDKLIIPPGETLQDELDAIGMSQLELSTRIGMSPKGVNEIIQGETPITVETAAKLEQVLNIPAYVWLNLESKYQLALLRAKEKEMYEKDSDMVSKFAACYRQLALYGYVVLSRKIEIKVESLRKFFGVSNLEYIQKLGQYAIFRKNGRKEVDPYSLASWLRIGELEAMKKEVAEFDKSLLRDKAVEISKLTTLSADEYSKKIERLLSEAGVKVVFSPYLSKSYVNGAVRWVGKTPILQISLRGRYSDIFWFTLMHEIGHLVLHGRKENFIEYDDQTTEGNEKEADAFAEKSLINTKAYDEFVTIGDFSRESMLKFATLHKIHPGIIAGRLAKDNVKTNFSYAIANSFRDRLQLTKDKI